VEKSNKLSFKINIRQSFEFVFKDCVVQIFKLISVYTVITQTPKQSSSLRITEGNKILHCLVLFY